MKLVCPGCGGTYSLEGWENDAAVRQFSAVMSGLPHHVQHHAANYLGLFRIGTRGLSWKRALRILQELKDLVAAGSVHWEGGETRPAPPELWAEVMLEMCEKGKRELENHNYLRKVVWTKARGIAAQAEREQVHAKPRSREEDTVAQPSTAAHKPTRRGCFTCESFRPPRGCEVKSSPTSGNQMLGCGQWKEKAAARAVGNLMGEILGVALVHHEGHEEEEE
jgi:hypothetical protein